jgi:hypothetical protein
MQKFWMLWVPTRGEPKVKHETRQIAEEEAKRLANKNGEPVYLLECVGCYELQDVPVKFVPAE